ncbi:MAG: DUF3795 domain-containing protein [Halobacteriota archaeon]
MSKQNKNLVGCCGIYCGLCTKYQSKAPSRCIGCRLGKQHDWCSIYRCCRKKKVITCIECTEYPCERYIRFRKWGGELYGSKAAEENLEKIKELGLEKWLEEQRQRQALFEGLLQNYNEGRSMSFYCKTCTRMSIELINEAIKEAKKRFTSEKVDKSDIKSKAKNLNSIIKDICLSSNVNMG